MRFNNIVRRHLSIPQPHFTAVRMSSTLVGDSGRVYARGQVLQRHREDHALSIFKAQYVGSFMCPLWRLIQVVKIRQ